MSLHSTDPTLYALFCLRRHTLDAHMGTLGQLTGRSASQVALDLLQLEALGLVEVEGMRLTMLGLTRAAQLARASGDAAVPARKLKTKPRKTKPPVAAKTADDEQAPEALSA